jgi:guanylate kinase
VDYYFLSREEFARRRAADDFLECAEVFGRGDWYGTLRSVVTAGLAAGKWVLLEIDVEGAMSVVARQPDVITIFLHPGGVDELERRLRARGTESEESIRRRLEVATRELAHKHRYLHEVINRTVPDAVREICEILKSHGVNPKAIGTAQWGKPPARRSQDQRQNENRLARDSAGQNLSRLLERGKDHW